MKKTRRPQHTRKRPDDSQPRQGHAQEGKEFSPADLPEQDPTATRPPRAAPAPGVPVTTDEYKRLKDEARRRQDRDEAPAQEDQPTKRDE